MTIETAIIVAAIALFGATVTAITTYHRSKIEERRILNEEQKWVLDLHAGLARRLHEICIEEYPAIFKELERLSHFCISDETTESLHELAKKLNAWGYGRSGLCMSSGTRDKLFKLRFKLIEFADRKCSPEQLMKDERTDLIESMRRDLSHTSSAWRDLPTLLAEIQHAVKSDKAKARE